MRLYGPGRAIEPDDAEFAELRARFADSCGSGVPLYRYEGERDRLQAWAERKGEVALEAYQREKNAASIDEIPGMRRR